MQSRLAFAGLGVQSAKGTPAPEATYRFGLTGGQVISAEIEEENLQPTGEDRLPEGRERITVTPGAALELYAIPKTLGVLLLGALGSVETSGTGPYEHTFEASPDLPYLTVFGEHNNDAYTVEDARVDSLEISWDGSGSGEVTAELLGCKVGAGSWSHGEHEFSRRPLRGLGGEFTVDGATARVMSGSVSIGNNLEPLHLSDVIEPDDVTLGNTEVEVSLTVAATDLSLWRSVVMGSAAGTEASGEPFYGDAVLKLVAGEDESLTLNLLDSTWVTEFPEADPDGGPVELELEGIALVNDQAAFSAVLENDVDSY